MKYFSSLVLLTFFLAALVFSISIARAIEPEEVLADPLLEERARDISAGLRCLVCQNQSIDDSEAGLARDLRRLVRERLVAGDDEEAIKTFLVSRYGEFVLLKPALNKQTYALWLAPVILLLLGGFSVRYYYNHHLKPRHDPVTELHEADQKKIAELLANTSQPGKPDEPGHP